MNCCLSFEYSNICMELNSIGVYFFLDHFSVIRSHIEDLLAQKIIDETEDLMVQN